MTGSGSEHSEQCAVFDWADRLKNSHPELGLLYAVPNGAKLPWKRDRRGKRFSPEAMRLKDEGLRPGVPDMCLPAARNGYHGLYIEMKYGGNKPTADQVWWLEQLDGQGYLAVVCWGADEAIQTIKDYIGFMEL